MSVTRLMLGRRPDISQQQAAFGYLALHAAAQQEIEAIVATLATKVKALKPIAYDPDDFPASDEVMLRNLAGIDQEFQQAAPWSLERAAKAVAISGSPTYLGSQELRDGGWTFYLIRAQVGNEVATLVRATNPTRALKHSARLIASFNGQELKPVTAPLVGIDHKAEAVIIGSKVYILRPQALENLMIDADAMKARAPQLSAKFSSGLAASLTNQATTWVETACSRNSNVARRVERLNRGADLSVMTPAKLRAGLKDADLPSKAFGAGSSIEISNLDHAVALVDIAADLYYQPRFEARGRKVAQFRRL